MPAEIDVEIGQQWQDDLATLESELDRIDGRSLSVDLDLDGQSRFESQVDTLTRDRTIGVDVDDDLDLDSFIPEEKTVEVHLERGDGWDGFENELRQFLSDIDDDATIEVGTDTEETTDQLQALRATSDLIDEINEKEIQLTVPESDVALVQKGASNINQRQGTNVPDGGAVSVGVADDPDSFERINARLSYAGDIDFDDARSNLSELLDHIEATEGSIISLTESADALDAELFVRSEIANKLRDTNQFDGRFSDPTIRFDAALDSDIFNDQLERRIGGTDFPPVPGTNRLGRPARMSASGFGAIRDLPSAIDKVGRDVVVDIDVDDFSNLLTTRGILSGLDDKDVDIDFDVGGSRFSSGELSNIVNSIDPGEWSNLSTTERRQIFNSAGFRRGFDIRGHDSPLSGLGRIFSGDRKSFFKNERLISALEEFDLENIISRPESVRSEFGLSERNEQFASYLDKLRRDEDMRNRHTLGRFDPEYDITIDGDRMDVIQFDPDRRMIRTSSVTPQGFDTERRTFSELEQPERQKLLDLRKQRRRDSEGRKRLQTAMEQLGDRFIDFAEQARDRVDSRFRGMSGGRIRGPAHGTDFDRLNAIDIFPNIERDSDGRIVGLNIPDINTRKIRQVNDRISNLGSSVKRKVIPTMSKWWNLLAAIIPLLISAGVQALGVAAAFGAIGVAGASLIGLGLIGHGDNLAESMENAKAQVQELKQEMFSVFQPAANLFAPIQENFFNALPQYAQPVAFEIKGFTQFEDILHAGAQGGFQWLADGLELINDYGPALEQLSMRFGSSLGDLTLDGLRWLFDQAIENQDLLMRLGGIFLKMGLTLYELSMAATRVFVAFEPILDIVLAVAQAINSPLSIAIIKFIATLWVLHKVLGGIGTLLTLILGSNLGKVAILGVISAITKAATVLAGILGVNATLMSIITGGAAALAGLAAIGVVWESVGDAPVVPNNFDMGLGPPDPGEGSPTPPGVPSPSGKGAGPSSGGESGLGGSGTPKIVYNHYGDVREQSDIEEMKDTLDRKGRDIAVEEQNRQIDSRHLTNTTEQNSKE